MLTLNLTPQMLDIIGKALGAQPYDLVAPIVVELQKQINAQQNSPPVVPPSPVDVQ